ncbi:unnamed protein product, partial [Ascophyllum nodosum]
MSDQAKWKGAFALRRLIDTALGAHSKPAVRLLGRERALYETIFRAEPQEHISQSTFLTVMRRVFGFHIAPLTGKVDHLALRTLSEVYKAFDVDKVGKVNWRCVLFMLKVAMNAQETVEEHLRWAIALYSSAGSFDPSCEEPVYMNDFKSLVYTMIRLDRVYDLDTVFDAGWKGVTAEGKVARRLAEASETDSIGERSKRPLKINIRLLKLMLQQQPLKGLFRPAKHFGLRDRGTWTYAIEEEYFDPLLLALVKKMRRDHRNDTATIIFQNNAHRRTFQIALASWQRLVRRRKRCARLMMVISGRFFCCNSSSAFFVLKRRAIACKACETIQRMYRGYLGRMIAAFLRDFTAKVVKAQAAFRGYKRRKEFLTWMYKKHLAATSVQRIVRGAFGRKRARCILEEYYDREMAVVDAEVERLEHKKWHDTVVKVQRRWKTRKACRVGDAISEIVAEMKQLQHRETREVDVYKYELSAWFKQQRDEQELSRILDDHSAKEKIKIVSYRHREKGLDENMRQRRLTAADKLEEQDTEKWQMEWREKGEDRALVYRELLEAVLKHPDTKQEKDLQRSLWAEIKTRENTVMQIAKGYEVELESAEALAIATEGVLLCKMDEERERVKEEMRVAATLLFEQQAGVVADKEEKISKFHQSTTEAAARVIQQMYFIFSATRIKQQRAKDVYTKHFDPESLRYYWYNTRIQTFSWEKPAGLGGWDVDAEDRWLVIPGSFDLQYYYNPKSYQMQWFKPADAVLCEV